MNAIKDIISIIQSAIDSNKAQARLNVIIGITKNTDCIKIRLPKKYVHIVELLALHGIDDSIEVQKIIDIILQKQ